LIGLGGSFQGLGDVSIRKVSDCSL
jgi:hypothetical protein